MGSIKTGPTCRFALALVVLGLLATGCGGGDDEGPDEGAGPDETVPTTATAPQRPEGEWTLIGWTTARSDTEDPPRAASEQRVRFTPECESGPCDLELAPAGQDGGFAPEGYPLAESATPDTRVVTVGWNAEDETYEWRTEPRTTSCTTAEGQTIEDGYTIATTYLLTFQPGDGDTPPSIEGTGTVEATGTPESVTQGCTDFTETVAIAAAPVDAFVESDTDLVGEYLVTEIVEATEPADQRPRGFVGVLFPAAQVAAAEDGYTVTGALPEPVLLERADDGWGGSGTAPYGTCQDGADPQFDSTETWSELVQVASTGSGPILHGRWDLRQEPNDAGSAAGCTTTTNTGWVIFVPSAAAQG